MTMAIDTGALDKMLSQLQQVSAVGAAKPVKGVDANGSDFGQALKTAIDQVNQVQQQAQQMTQDFATGSENVNLQDVMVNLQKANLSFQQMVQVRNKLVSAYHDIMNMPV
jgi:flagellar hook-basal body complex protein FliE